MRHYTRFSWLRRLLIGPVGTCYGPWSSETGEFVGRAVASGLVTLRNLRSIFSTFVADTRGSPHTGLEVDAFCDFLVSRKLLTSWQCDKLQQGRYNGFFFGKYVLTNYVGWNCKGRRKSVARGGDRRAVRKRSALSRSWLRIVTDSCVATTTPSPRNEEQKECSATWRNGLRFDVKC